MIYIGFIVDSRIPSWRNCIQHKNPWALLGGWGSSTPVAAMRYRWIADHVNASAKGIHYELYRPWRRYQAVIFLKSMGLESIALQARLKEKGVKTIFDANVDYFTSATGTFFYDGMAPSQDQQVNAVHMARECDAVIGDSRYIAEKAGKLNTCVASITDNVLDRLISDGSEWHPARGKMCQLIWCGQAVKLFELLAIKEVLLEWKNRIFLRIITNSLESLQKWYPLYRDEFHDLLKQVPHEIVPFQSIASLMSAYDAGGVFIAPRFLDNSYNLGHTEWKITLPMARGRVVLCSPQASYNDVSEYAAEIGIRVCHDSDGWRAAFAEILDSSFDWQKEQGAACAVVREHYATSIVANNHLQFIQSVLR